MMMVVKFLASLLLIQLSLASKVEPNFPERIVNGEDAEPNSIPYQVSVQFDDGGFFRHVCGGTILNEDYVLTAAHCILEGYDYRVVLGEHDLLSDDGVEQAIEVEELVQHPEYTIDSVKILNDVGVLKLATPAELNDVAQKVVLPDEGFEVPAGAVGIGSGWGRIDLDNPILPNILQVADMPIHTDQECLEFYSDSFLEIYVDEHVCVGGSGVGGCNGDSGGPVTYEGVQIGVFSFLDKSEGCEGYPTVLAKTGHFRDWIDENSQQ